MNTTVMPFILRGVSLLGVNSVECAYDLRQRIWQRLETELKPRHLDTVVRGEVDLAGIAETCEALLARQVSGRTLVRFS
ncbi:hypothetical protein [Alkalilimnicola ehrlichii]|uniref:hypothetical protein n=1 Tax=Alkalilimnicola ehrlichii TaxID=351052 RepID=UPI002868680A|nr:hypothetical protein [Alkalilimnicola ehrlichii]